jgi:hypothetical protein
VCLPLAGCVFGARGVGPEGLSEFNTDLRSVARQGDFDRALEMTEEGPDESGDDLLRQLQHAVLLRYDGQFEQSNQLLQEAAREIEDRHTKSVSRAVLSVLSNDRALAYNPPSFERMMVHYYGALNYLSLGDPEEAAVEARLLSARLLADTDKQLDDRDVRTRRSLHYFAGAVFETAGEWNAAEVAYRNAWEGWNTNPGAPEPEVARTDSVPAREALADSALTRVTSAGSVPTLVAPADSSATLAAPADTAPDPRMEVDSSLVSTMLEDLAPSRGMTVDSSLARGLEALTPAFIARDRAPAPDSGEVILVLETGFVAHRIERAAAVPIFSGEDSSLKEGDDSSRYNASVCAATRALGAQASLEENDCSQPTGSSLFILKVAWPELRRSSEPIRGARISARSGSTLDADLPESGLTADGVVASTAATVDPEPNLTVSATSADEELWAPSADSVRTVPTVLTIDLSTAAMSEYDAVIVGIVAKTIARATGKYLVVQAAREAAEEEDETAGFLVGLLGNAAAAASERADTRSWHLLPGTIRIARMSLPVGVHSIELDLDALQQSKPLKIDLGEVTVRPGSVTILPIRSWP